MTAVKRNDRNGEWWVDFRWKGRRIRSKAPLQSKRGAEQLERQLRRQFSEDEDHGMDPFAGPPPKFAEFVERWMRDYVVPRHRPSTIRSKRNYLRLHILPAIGTKPLDEISSLDMDRLATRMVDAGLRPKTVNNAVSVAKSALRCARRWRLLRAVPETPWLKSPEPEFRVLTRDEERGLVDACDPGFWQTLVVFILHTGVRFSEAAAVTWDDLVLDRPQPIVRIRRGGADGKPGPTKTGSHRELPLDRVVLELLGPLPRWHTRIFPAPSGGQMNPASKTKYLHKFCDRAGYPRHGWHALRHTFATRLAEEGVPLQLIQKLLGHTTLKMTMRYVHVSAQAMAASSNIIESIMAAPERFGHQVVTKPIPVVDLPRHESLPLPSRQQETRRSAELLTWSG